MESIKEFNTDILETFRRSLGAGHCWHARGLQHDDDQLGQPGTIWAPRGNGRQIATIYIKPSRYTFNYLEKSDYYTISFFRKKSAPISPISAAIPAATRTSSPLRA